eukprot:1196323-Prorocentrum_minimum.AAC.1
MPVEALPFLSMLSALFLLLHTAAAAASLCRPRPLLAARLGPRPATSRRCTHPPLSPTTSLAPPRRALVPICYISSGVLLYV